MKKKLWLFFAVVFCAGILGIIITPRHERDDTPNENIWTAQAYLEQIQDAMVDYETHEVDLGIVEILPDRDVLRQYWNEYDFRVYEFPGEPYQLIPKMNGVSWLPWDRLDEIPPGSLILGPYVEPCPEFHTGFRDAKITRTELFK